MYLIQYNNVQDTMVRCLNRYYMFKTQWVRAELDTIQNCKDQIAKADFYKIQYFEDTMG